MFNRFELDRLANHLQGILLALILGSGSNTTDTFTRQTRAKTYLVFILAFTALSNIIVGTNLLLN